MRTTFVVLAAVGGAGAVLVVWAAGSDFLAKGCGAIAPADLRFTANCVDASTAAHLSAAALLSTGLARPAVRRRHA